MTAVLEAGGIFGATTFVIFLLALFGNFAATRNVPAMAALITFLTSNMAEVTMFSPGGSGGFGWIMIGAAMILGDHCWHRSPTPTPPRASV